MHGKHHRTPFPVTSETRAKGVLDLVHSVHGKHHRTPFPVRSETRAKGVLDLVHSDVCGKLSPKSIGGAEYFVTFIDDRRRYVWLYNYDEIKK